MRFTRVLARFTVMAVVLGLVASGCKPTPRRTLSAEEKLADLHWAYSIFGDNYAPLEYKEKLFGFNWTQLKAQYEQEAIATKTNEEFYMVLHKFVSEFRDAHTSSSLEAAELPGRSRVAYLGFAGERKGKNLVVTKLLPTVAGKGSYPIRVDDEITALDGVALVDIVKNEFVKYRNLGHDEGNVTYHINKIFNRDSVAQAMPKELDARLTVMRGKETFDVVLPWIVKDALVFAQEQSAAASAPKKKKSDITPLSIGGMDMATFFETARIMLAGGQKADWLPAIFSKIHRENPAFNYFDTFEFVENRPTWDSRMVQKAVAAKVDPKLLSVVAELEASRDVPKTKLWVSQGAYPIYINPENGKFVAYMYLPTFSPDEDEDSVLRDVASALSQLESLGVKDLIIDMINNGGGSISLGMKLAQLFSKDKIDMPEIQFKLSESWLDEFQRNSIKKPNEVERFLSQRVYEALSEDKFKSGQLLSRKFNIETLAPFQIERNRDLKGDFKIVLLINEMCASMCDVFAGIMQDNGKAKIVGSRSLGAGGNVVSHEESPNAHLTVRQTESLLVRKDGSYLENRGVTPDVEMPVNEYAPKYKEVRAKALELLAK